MRITKIMKIIKIQYENQETNENQYNHRIPQENHDNHRHPRIS